VPYHDLVRDPMAIIRRVYAHFGMTLTGTAEARMRRFLADNPKGKHGPHRYSLETFGLEADDLACRFKAYREHFGIQSESSPGRS
jgi:hypothetical protein